MKIKTVLSLVIIWALASFNFNGSAIAQAVDGDDAPLRFGRFEFEGKVWYGFLSSGGVHQLNRSFFDPDAKRTGEVIPLEKVRLLAPVVPQKVIGIAWNYKSHNSSATRLKNNDLKFFSKLPSSVIASGEEIIPPIGSTSLHYEGEMVIVIGARAKNVSVKKADDYIFGVTAGNDVTERGFPFSPFDVLRSKGSDTMAPLGPWIVPGLSYDKLTLVTKLNGKVVQKTSTRKMVFSVRKIVSILSRYITLEPGDVIYTGTAGTTGAMKYGDKVEVLLEGVGILENTIGKTVGKSAGE